MKKLLSGAGILLISVGELSSGFTSLLPHKATTNIHNNNNLKYNPISVSARDLQVGAEAFRNVGSSVLDWYYSTDPNKDLILTFKLSATIVRAYFPAFAQQKGFRLFLIDLLTNGWTYYNTKNKRVAVPESNHLFGWNWEANWSWSSIFDGVGDEVVAKSNFKNYIKSDGFNAVNARDNYINAYTNNEGLQLQIAYKLDGSSPVVDTSNSLNGKTTIPKIDQEQVILDMKNKGAVTGGFNSVTGDLDEAGNALKIAFNDQYSQLITDFFAGNFEGFWNWLTNTKALAPDAYPDAKTLVPKLNSFGKAVDSFASQTTMDAWSTTAYNNVKSTLKTNFSTIFKEANANKFENGFVIMLYRGLNSEGPISMACHFQGDFRPLYLYTRDYFDLELGFYSKSYTSYWNSVDQITIMNYFCSAYNFDGEDPTNAIYNWWTHYSSLAWKYGDLFRFDLVYTFVLDKFQDYMDHSVHNTDFYYTIACAMVTKGNVTMQLTGDIDSDLSLYGWVTLRYE